jgi:hypothetical protein
MVEKDPNCRICHFLLLTRRVQAYQLTRDTIDVPKRELSFRIFCTLLLEFNATFSDRSNNYFI